MNEIEDPMDDIRAKVKKEYAELWDTKEFQEALDEYENDFLVFLYGAYSYYIDDDVDDLVNLFEESAINLFDSEQAWAEDIADRLGMYECLDESSPHSRYLVFDWEQYVYDAKCGGSFTFWDTEDGVYVQPNF